MMERYYVYEHWLDGKCIYVGHGNENRIAHLGRSNKNHRKLIKGRRKEVEVVIHAIYHNKRLAATMEEYRTIELMKTYDLTNKMYGYSAPGKMNGFYGKSHTEETKRLLSRANTGKPGWAKGKIFSGETRRKMSVAKTGTKVCDKTKLKISKATKGEKNPMYGKTHSEESMESMVKNRKDFGKMLLTVIDDNGEIKEQVSFDSINQSSRYTGIPSYTIARKTRDGSKLIVDGMIFERMNVDGE